MKPIIGITVEPNHDPGNARTHGTLTLNWNYPEAVSNAGGVPVMIPPTADMAEIARMIDGWLIPGGLDIDASQFGEKNHPEVNLQDPSRYRSEADLYGHIDPEMPVLGICYGCQFLNVVRGGSLIQHLPEVVGHELHEGGTLEDYQVLADSKLSEVASGPVQGKSYHHQSVGRLGRGLKVVAETKDGTVEAVEATDRPWLVAVQWHPERSPEDPANVTLLRTFVEAAAKYSEARGKR